MLTVEIAYLKNSRNFTFPSIVFTFHLFLTQNELLELPDGEPTPRMIRRPSLFDPSELHHFGNEVSNGGIGGTLDKNITQFRRYSIDVTNIIKERVRKTYLEMHTNQTVAFGRSKVQLMIRCRIFVCINLFIHDL